MNNKFELKIIDQRTIGDPRKAGPLWKCVSAVCIALVVILSSVFTAKYFQLYNVALTYNETAVEGLTYDQCGKDMTGEHWMRDYESGWTQVFKFQAILNMIFLCISGLSLFAMCVPGVSCCLMCCGNCLGCPMLAAIILTGIRGLNSNG